jgi:dihydrofolate reductase
LALRDFELHPQALIEPLFRFRDAGGVDEDILPAIVGRDEPVASVPVEPLHHTGGHKPAASDTLLLGRRTYQEFAAYWPDKTVEDDPFADYINNTPKLVVSTTLKSVEWRNSTLINGDVAEELTNLKQQPGKDIAITGGATLVQSLLRDGLLDELELLLYPIVVSTGKRLFEDIGDQVALKLVDSKTFTTGVLSLTYEPTGR